jgi:uncharacterized protein with HEPN domain
MSKRSLSLLIEDILESIDKIGRYTEGLTQDSFERDEKTSDAVVRNLEIIGEAAARLSEDFTSLHPEIEWAKIKGLRNQNGKVILDGLPKNVQIYIEVAVSGSLL